MANRWNYEQVKQFCFVMVSSFRTANLRTVGELDSLCEAVGYVLHVELKVSSSSFVNISAFKIQRSRW